MPTNMLASIVSEVDSPKLKSILISLWGYHLDDVDLSRADLTAFERIILRSGKFPGLKRVRFTINLVSLTNDVDFVTIIASVHAQLLGLTKNNIKVEVSCSIILIEEDGDGGEGRDDEDDQE